jgi:hypothetical protein
MQYLEHKAWMDAMTIDDLPNDDLKFIAEHMGINTALMLIVLLPGLTVTIPKNAFKLVKERYIMHNYDGTKYSINKLALDCETTQRQIYKIVKRNLKHSPNALPLFDE